MKPVTLLIQAFGSFGRETLIDFTVPDQNLFLITGNTGAGKTTIFDAIVFALYGEASSNNNKKDGTELQSQFAPPGTEPYVELMFSERSGGEENLYRVRRVPRHQRPRKKGSGRGVVVRESVTLIMPDGTEYARNQKETDEKLEEIIGLTKNQFMQVAMIAQGEFMEFLRADSNRKKEIFRRLFGTELYSAVVEELRNRRSEKLSVIDQIHTVCKAEVSRARIPETYEGSELLQDVRDRLLHSERLNITDLERFHTELEKLCRTLEEKKEKARIRYENLSSQRDECRDALIHARNLQESFSQMDTAEQILAGCREEEAGMKKAAGRIIQIRSAYEILSLYQRYSDADRTVLDAETKMKEQQGLLPELKEDCETAQGEAAAVRKKMDKQLQDFAKVSEHAQRALDMFSRIKETGEEIRKRQKDLEEAEKEKEAAEKDLADLEMQERAWKNQENELADAGALYERWQQKTREAGKLIQEIASVYKAEKETAHQRRKAGMALQKYESARRLYQEKNAEYVCKQTAFLDAQAGLLALELQPGKACPVCGSLEHPNPCSLTENHLELTREMVEESSREVSEWNRKQNDSAVEAHEAAALLKEKEESLSEQTRWLGQRMTESIPGSKEPAPANAAEADRILTDWKNRLDSEGIVRDRDLKTLERVRQSLKEVNVLREVCRERADNAARKVNGTKSALAVSRAAMKSLEEQKEYSTEQEARAQFADAKEKKELLESACQAAQKRVLNAQTALHEAETLIRQFQESLPVLSRQKDQLYSSYQSLMLDKNLNEEAWRELTQQCDLSEVDSLQNSVEQYQQRKASAEGACEMARKAIGDRLRPDIESLEEKNKLVEEQLISAQDEWEMLKETWNTNAEVYGALSPRMEERSLTVSEYDSIDSLYQRLAGKKTGSRMDLETFVQRYYLQQTLKAANPRFLEMSAGQFELRMVGADRAGEGRNRGLDLMVYSHVTGKEREIRTLSGGESFLAALSLALGMADQIQQKSSFVSLDVLFVDEGFGSLDDHSRNQAVRVLQQMAGGSKMIGIISHVSELKQEIEDQLIVEKDREGSRVRWQIS